MLRKLFQEYIAAENLFEKKDKLLVAVSGGADSVVLLHLLQACGYDVSIAHCNFKLRGEESLRDALFVQQLAAVLKVPFYSTDFETAAIAKVEKTSIEETARALRYRWFEEIRAAEKSSARFILTAHHADDNAETAAMNFFRGTGLKGLRGMLPKNGKIVRPLLFASKNDLTAYASQYDLTFVTDSSNAENNFTRNYFRNVLLPAAEKVFPQSTENIVNNLARLRDAEIIFRAVIEKEKKKILKAENGSVRFPVNYIKSSKTGRTLLYEIITGYGFTSGQVADAVKLLDAQSGKYITSATHRLLRNRDWLELSPLRTEEQSLILIENGEAEILFPAGKLSVNLRSVTDYHTPENVALLSAKGIHFPLIVRRRQRGDYFYPLGMSKKKKISRFLIDKKLSLTEKENVWVVESQRKILWVIGHRIDDRFKITRSDEEAVELKFLPA